MTKKDTSKKWWTSKTIWANIAGIAVGIITLIQDQLVAGGALTLLGTGGIVLRFISAEAIKRHWI